MSRIYAIFCDRVYNAASRLRAAARLGDKRNVCVCGFEQDARNQLSLIRLIWQVSGCMYVVFSFRMCNLGTGAIATRTRAHTHTHNKHTKALALCMHSVELCKRYELIIDLHSHRTTTTVAAPAAGAAAAAGEAASVLSSLIRFILYRCV